MSTYRLDKLFSPQSVAVVGASPRESSAGHAVLRNLLRGGFAGAIHLVNPRYDAIEGVRARPPIFSIGRGRKNPAREFPGSPSSP
jgi:acetyltransferase